MNQENILSIATRGIFKFKIVQGGKSIINLYVLFNLRPIELSMMQYQAYGSINDKRLKENFLCYRAGT